MLSTILGTDILQLALWESGEKETKMTKNETADVKRHRML